jgi:hypothetical protein
LLRSLQNARFTFDFLVSALDEVLAEDIWEDKIFLRSPIRNAVLDPECSAILAPYADRTSLPTSLKEQQVTELYDELRNALGLFGTDATSQRALMVDREFILSDLTISIYKALSYADEHDLVILYGRLAQEATVTLKSCPDADFSRPPLPRSHRARALANFMNEQATRPQLFAFLLNHLAELDSSCVPINDEGKRLIRHFLSSCATGKVINSFYATRLLQLNEFYIQACATDHAIKKIDFFFD